MVHAYSIVHCNKQEILLKIQVFSDMTHWNW